MVRDVSALAGEGDPTRVAFDGELLRGDERRRRRRVERRRGIRRVERTPQGCRGCPRERPGRSRAGTLGGADRAVILWDARGHALARLELGAAVTALTAPTERTAVAGTETGFVELLALGAPNAPRDERVTKMVKSGRVETSAFAQYAPRYDHGARRRRRSTPFARIVPVREGPVDVGSSSGRGEVGPRSSGATAAERAMAKGMLGGAGETAAETKARGEGGGGGAGETARDGRLGRGEKPGRQDHGGGREAVFESVVRAAGRHDRGTHAPVLAV